MPLRLLYCSLRAAEDAVRCLKSGSVSFVGLAEYWSAEYRLVNEQHWWFHESVLLEKANRFATASKGQKNMRKAHECVSGHVRTLPVLEITTSGYIECTGVKAIMLTSHPVVSWVEDKSFHRWNICLTWVLSRLLLLCLGSSRSCLSVPILCFNGRRDGSHVYLEWFVRLQQLAITHLSCLFAFGIIKQFTSKGCRTRRNNETKTKNSVTIYSHLLKNAHD